MASVESTVRNSLKTLAAAVAGMNTTRIKLGLDDFGAATEFFAKFRTGTITNKVLTSNVATLTLPAHGFEAGDYVTNTLDTPDESFDGARLLTAVTTDTYSFASVHANIATAAATGFAQHTPYLVILPARRVGMERQPIDQWLYEVVARLYFGVTSNADYDFAAIENIIYPVMDSWMVSAPGIEDLINDEPVLKTELTPIVGMYQIQGTFRGC